MREKDRAVIERLREIVEFVEGLGRGIAVIENGDCLSWEDVKRVRETTIAHSVMIARGSEASPSCFPSNPLEDIEKTTGYRKDRLFPFGTHLHVCIIPTNTCR